MLSLMICMVHRELGFFRLISSDIYPLSLKCVPKRCMRSGFFESKTKI